jgi:ketosteroid isomerase-like protein
MGAIDEIKQLERNYWSAIQHKDVWSAMSLSDDNCIVAGAQGVGSLDRGKLGEMMKQATYELTNYTIDDKSFMIRKLTDEVVLVAYRVYEDLVVDGKPESLEAFDTSVWVRQGDRWLCAMHTESLKGDPFGRHDIDMPHFEQNVTA